MVNRPEGKTQLTGIVQGFTYASAEFSVAKIKPEGQMLPVVIVGPLLGVAVGQTVTVHGQWAKHPRFGEQFRVDAFATEVPKTRDGLIAYLASDLIPGLGEVKATLLVDHFREKTIQVLDHEPGRITEVSGIGRKTAQKIIVGWQQHRKMANLQMFLQGHGLGGGLAARIYQAYEDKALATLQQNPYMITDVRGFGFLTADKVARSLGLPDDDPFRIRSAIAHALDQAATDEGHLYLPRDDLVKRVEKLLNHHRDGMGETSPSILVSLEAIELQIAALQQAEGVLVDMLSMFNGGNLEAVSFIALPWAYYTELGSATKLKQLLANRNSMISRAFKETRWNQTLKWVQSQTGITLAQSQAQAVQLALTEQVAILTGGPGTGKTTTVRSILTLLNQTEARVLLAAPTGKAAKRLSESTGVEAQTIHRMLGVEGPGKFAKNEDNLLKADMVIIDEMSMVDASLFYALIKALKPETHLLLVGDVDQLPSVGPGDVLNDLIEAGTIPTVQLDVIFRQGEESGIVPNAHQINAGQMPTFSQVGQGSNDFFWFGIDDDERAATQIIDLVASRIPERFGIPTSEVQVLSPMYRGAVGIESLNKALQARLNPSQGKGTEYQAGDRLWRVGDRLMQTRNDYNKDVFNGDTGELLALDLGKRQALLDFEGRQVVYELNDLREDTVLAYACSIHKSQGSEYPAVVIPVTTGHYVMLARNLIYTGITRAKQLVILVGTMQALAMAVNNDEAAQRYTALTWRLTT